MKRENLKEAKVIVDRITSMESAVSCYENFKETEASPYRLFVNFVKLVTNKKTKPQFELGYNHDFYVGLSQKQQDELCELIKKWINEDKEELEKM